MGARLRNAEIADGWSKFVVFVRGALPLTAPCGLSHRNGSWRQRPKALYHASYSRRCRTPHVSRSAGASRRMPASCRQGGFVGSSTGHSVRARNVEPHRGWGENLRPLCILRAHYSGAGVAQPSLRDLIWSGRQRVDRDRRSGTATVTIDTSPGATHKGKFDVELNGCPADAEPTIMHLHDGLKGAKGGVFVNSGLVAGEWKLTAGAGRITKEIPTIGTLVVSNIRVSPNGFYFNVHKGECRRCRSRVASGEERGSQLTFDGQHRRDGGRRHPDRAFAQRVLPGSSSRGGMCR